MSLDIVIRGGSVADGTGREPYRADVGVAAGRVAWVAEGGTDAAVDAREVVDATGRVVMPGFVDAHSHADGVHTRPEVYEALLRQGVTTVITGQDGLGYAPGSAAALAASEEYFGILDGPIPDRLREGSAVADLLANGDGSAPLNVATLLPMGTLWLDAAGPATELTDDQLRHLVKAVEQGLADGAAGLSTGLEYTPNCFAGLRELSAACRPVAAAGLAHVTHMRGYELAVHPAFDEVAEVSRRTGVGLHVSHFRGPAAAIELLLDRAAGDGIEVSFDSYPYQRACTILSMRVLPGRLTAGGRSATLGRLAARAVREDLVREWTAAEREPELAGVSVANADHPDWRWTEGRTIGACAETLGQGVFDTVLDLLVECRLQVSVVTAPPATSGEDDMRQLLHRSEQVAGSDGIFLGAFPHPRAWGTFARLLGRHVRDLGDWSLGQAAQHLSTRTCQRFGLGDRGVVRAGAVADLVVVDPTSVRDNATYAQPRQLATGIDDVLVAGVTVLSGQQLTHRTPGTGIRAGSA